MSVLAKPIRNVIRHLLKQGLESQGGSGQADRRRRPRVEELHRQRWGRTNDS